MTLYTSPCFQIRKISGPGELRVPPTLKGLQKQIPPVTWLQSQCFPSMSGCLSTNPKTGGRLAGAPTGTTHSPLGRKTHPAPTAVPLPTPSPPHPPALPYVQLRRATARLGSTSRKADACLCLGSQNQPHLEPTPTPVAPSASVFASFHLVFSEEWLIKLK